MRPHRSPTVEYIRAHNLAVPASSRIATIEQAKKTGGMVALYPRSQDIDVLHIDDGEPKDDMHCTVIYLGEDVSDQDPTELISQLDQTCGHFPPIHANVFAHALFNPDGEEPCAVYLIGGNTDLGELHRELKSFVAGRYPGAAEQHDPYVPHITAGYDLAVTELDYTGPIEFDRIGLRWPDHDQDWTL